MFVDETGNHNAVFFGTTANSHWSADVPAAQIYDPSLSGYVANTLSMDLGANSMIQAGWQHDLADRLERDSLHVRVFRQNPGRLHRDEDRVRAP